MYKKSKHIFRT